MREDHNFIKNNHSTTAGFFVFHLTASQSGDRSDPGSAVEKGEGRGKREPWTWAFTTLFRNFSCGRVAVSFFFWLRGTGGFQNCSQSF